MHRFIEIIKSHPMGILAGVVIGVAIIFLMTRSGTATGGNYAAPVDNSAALAATNAQLVAQQDAIRMQGNLAATALQAHLDDNQTALGLSTISATVAMDGAQKGYALAQQKESDTNNISLLALAGQTALASQMQGYTAELASQGATSDVITTLTGSLNQILDDRLWRSAYGGDTGAQAANAYGGNSVGGGGAVPKAVAAASSGIKASTQMFTAISNQATAAANVSNAGLAAFYSATLHQLTEPVSSSPTAVGTSH